MTPSTSPALRRSLVATIATALASLALLALAACGTSTTPAAQTTPLPDAASVLQQAEAATLTNAKFTITGTVDGATIQANSTGQVTTKPAASDVTFIIPATVNGKSENKTIEQITDKATGTIFTRTTLGSGHPSAWAKSKLSKPSSDYIDILSVTDLASFKSPTMVGADTVGGVAVWHLQSTASSSTTTGSTGSTGTSATQTVSANATTTANATTSDLYVRQDNNLPAKAVIQMTGGTSPSTVTFEFTTYNTSGLKITIP